MNISIVNTNKARIPAIDFSAMKDAILGKNYELTLVITTPAQIRKYNLTYRGKDEPTDILSFPYSDKNGEIYICPSETRKEAKKFDRKYNNFFAFLFIHGCTHLKGFDHGGTMEGHEISYRKKFGI